MTTVYMAEHFYSIQGEGMDTGVPSLFIRPFGCNLNCKGFGQPDPSDESTYHKQEFTEEQLKISPQYGCDSPKAVQPCFKKYCTPYKSGKEFFDEIKNKYKYEAFENIVITGGEPMLYQEFWIEFFEALKEFGVSNYSVRHITFETNGSIFPQEKLLEYIENNAFNFDFLFSVSPKLNCVAGVDEKVSIKIENLAEYVRKAYEEGAWRLQLKFVYNGDERAYNRLLEIKNEIEERLGKSVNPQYFMLMPVGAWQQEKELQRKTVEVCLKEGFRYTGRAHVEIFGKINGV